MERSRRRLWRYAVGGPDAKVGDGKEGAGRGDEGEVEGVVGGEGGRARRVRWMRNVTC
jgi:hypothetical protein